MKELYHVTEFSLHNYSYMNVDYIGTLTKPNTGTYKGSNLTLGTS